MKNKLGNYTCDKLTIYSTPSIMSATEAVRYTMNPPLVYPIDRQAVNLNLTAAPFQRLKVVNGEVEGAELPGTAEPRFQLVPNEGVLDFSLPGADPQLEVYEGTLECGRLRFAVQAYYQHRDGKVLEIFVPLDREVAGKERSAVCTALDLTLLKRSGEKELKSKVRFTFSQSQTVLIDGRHYAATLPSGVCYSAFE